MGWKASCHTAQAGFRCLGKYESKAGFVGKSEEEDLLKQPQGWGWIPAVGHRPILQGDFETLEGGARGLGCTPCLGQEGSVAGGAVGPRPPGHEVHVKLLIKGLFPIGQRLLSHVLLYWKRVISATVDDIFCASSTRVRDSGFFQLTQGTSAQHLLQFPREREYLYPPTFGK